MPLHNTNSSNSHRPKVPSSKHQTQNQNQNQPNQSHTPASTIPPKTLKTPGLVTLDGRTLEGGGQLVRVALTLSALLSIPVYIHHIRGKRAAARGQRNGGGGGLKESHLAALEFLQQACGAEVYGAEVGGTEVVFLPGNEKEVTGLVLEKGEDGGREHVIELRNPGSVWLIFQALYPLLLFGGLRREGGGASGGGGGGGGGEEEEGDPGTVPVTLRVRGGTNVSMSMSAEYVQQVFLPVMEKIGLPAGGAEVVVRKRGWTHGRIEVGEVEIRVVPLRPGQALKGFVIREEGNSPGGQRSGRVRKVTISVMASPLAVLEHLVAAAEEKVRAQFSDIKEVEVLVQEDSGDSRRMYLLLVVHLQSGWRIGRDWLYDGKLKNRDERVIATQMAEKVVRDLRNEVDIGGSVDEFMQDQLVIFQALARGTSEVDAGTGRQEGSEHTRTVKWVVEQMLGKQMFADTVVDGYGLMALGNPLTDRGHDTDDLANQVGRISIEV